MGFTLFSFGIDRSDGIYFLHIASIHSAYNFTRAIIYFDYRDDELEWDFLFLNFIYKRYIKKETI
jgi:hypothetical protein